MNPFLLQKKLTLGRILGGIIILNCYGERERERERERFSIKSLAYLLLEISSNVI